MARVVRLWAKDSELSKIIPPAKEEPKIRAKSVPFLPPLYTAAQLAEQLNLKPSKLERAFRRGEIETVRPGGKGQRFATIDSILIWLNKPACG